jgi:hypothetical protein
MPSVLSVARNTVTAGGPAFVTEVDGVNFIPSTTIGVNGFPRPTTFISSTAVNATILAEDIAVPGTILIDAVNPPPGGGTSFTQTILVVPHPGPPTSTISGAFTAYMQGVTGSGDSATRTITQLQFVADGQGNITSGTLEQFGGGVSQKSADISGSTIVADANALGRMSIHLNAHGASLFATDLTAYVDSSGGGTIVAGTVGNAMPQLGLGTITQQSGGPFSEASFGGGCRVASVPWSVPSGGVSNGASLSGKVDFSAGATFFTGVFDDAAARETAAPQAVTGTLTMSDPVTGRFAGRISGLPRGEQAVTGYLQGGNEFSFVINANGKQPALMVCGGK